MPKIKRLLLAGGGYADIPLIESAQKLGLYVITSGNRSEDLGHNVSNEYCPADFSDPDAILDVAKQKGIDYICPCANDFSAISTSYAAEILGLPGHDSFETSKLIHHKDLYRSFATKYGIPTPKAMGFSNLESAVKSLDNFSLPIIIKPVDLTGGKGISKISNFNEAKDALAKAFSISKAQRVVIEEFLVGSRHGFSTLIRDGKVVFHFSDNEHYFLNQYMVSGASTPTTVSSSVISDLIKQIEKIAALMSLKSGIFHVQYVLYNNQPVIIEICRRPPGDLYIKLVQYATGLDYPSWIVKFYTGEDCSQLKQEDVNGFYLRHCVMADKAGILTDIKFSHEIENNIQQKFMWWEAGTKVDNYLTDKFGIVFLKFGSMEEMLDKTNRMHELIKAKIEPY